MRSYIEERSCHDDVLSRTWVKIIREVTTYNFIQYFIEFVKTLCLLLRNTLFRTWLSASISKFLKPIPVSAIVF